MIVLRAVLELRHVCQLTVAAASGLVRHDGRLFVVADDSAVIAVHSEDGGPLDLVALDGDPSPRPKAHKPDLESLALEPGGALLAIGSGSTGRRERGWRWRPQDGAVEALSLADLYGALRREIEDLNVEGLAFAAGRAWLAQRGNGRRGRNAIVELAPGGFTAESVIGVVDYDLGGVDGVPLTFSDLAPLPDGRLLFCAVAEAGESTYEDGACLGSGVGILNPRRRRVDRLVPLAGAPKVEGVTLAARGLDLLLVADDDDPATPAPLLAGSL